MFQVAKKISGMGLIGWLLIVAITALIGAVAASQASSFYAHLTLPNWAPSTDVFAPVWSLLYLMMAFAAWQVWRQRRIALTTLALWLFITQLVFNALWCWLFFAWHQGALAFATIIILWALIIMTTILFFKIKPLAGWLMLPYLLWVTFAALLNFSVWQLNPLVL